jgi:polyisoprenoid-binding protein YceI
MQSPFRKNPQRGSRLREDRHAGWGDLAPGAVTSALIQGNQEASMVSRGPWRWLRWVIGAVVVIIVLGVAGPFVYFHFIEGNSPAPLSIRLTPSASAPGISASGTQSASPGSSQDASGSVAGTWAVGSGSRVGYRVKETLVGQSHTAVGRSSSVTGSMTIKGSTVKTARFTVKMATIHTDSAQRDAQFDGRIMDVATYPDGTFALTKPISLAPLPAAGTIKTYSATGTLTLHGKTVPVTFPLRAERTAGTIEVQGSIPVLFSKWGIPNPSFTGFVTTQNHGIMEFLLDFRPA